jgi:SnoaL-like domain
MTALAFRTAVEAGDVDGAVACLAPDVVFHSPVAFKPFEGRKAVEGVLRLVAETFEDFRYELELSGDRSAGLIFRARVGEREVHGLDLVRLDEGGLIDEFTVMLRPLSAAIAMAEAMGPKVIAAGLK